MSIRINGSGFPIKLILTTALLLTFCQGSGARDQWQINRPDPPPTGPIPTAKYGNSQQPKSKKGFTGALGGSNPAIPPSTNAQNGAPELAPGAGQIPGLVPADQVGTQPVPGTPPVLVPGQSTLPDFFKQIVGTRIPTGTILTGVIDSDLSSIKSKRGDVFAVLLPHGYVTQGQEVVPANSKILGVVVDSFPAKFQRHGMPGRLSISLKTLVFPDGRSCKVNGFIDHNPAHDQEKEPKTKMAGFGLGEYANSFKGMLYSPVSGIAWVHNKQMQGKEFFLKGGTPVSVKLNTAIDIAKMSNPTAPLGTPGLTGVPTTPYPGQFAPGVVPGLAGNQIPGLAGQPAPGGIPGLTGQAPPGFSSQPGAIPGLANQPGATPGLVNAPPAMPNQGFNTTQNNFPSIPQAPGAIPPAGNPVQIQAPEDPNSIFKTPIASPRVPMEDPF